MLVHTAYGRIVNEVWAADCDSVQDGRLDYDPHELESDVSEVAIRFTSDNSVHGTFGDTDKIVREIWHHTFHCLKTREALASRSALRPPSPDSRPSLRSPATHQRSRRSGLRSHPSQCTRFSG